LWFHVNCIKTNAFWTFPWLFQVLVNCVVVLIMKDFKFMKWFYMIIILVSWVNESNGLTPYDWHYLQIMLWRCFKEGWHLVLRVLSIDKRGGKLKVSRSSKGLIKRRFWSWFFFIKNLQVLEGQFFTSNILDELRNLTHLTRLWVAKLFGLDMIFFYTWSWFNTNLQECNLAMVCSH